MDLRSKRMSGMAHIILYGAMLVLYTRIGGLGMIYVAGSMELFYVIVSLFLGGIPDTMEYMIRILRKRDQYKDAEKAQKAGILYGIFGTVLAEISLLLVKELLVMPSGLKYVSQLLSLLMITVPFLAILQIIRGFIQAELDRIFTGVSQFIFVGFMIAGTVCAIWLLGEYGTKAANLMQSVMLKHFYVVLGLIPGIIIGALAAIVYLIIIGFVYKGQLYIFEKQSGVSKESMARLMWQLFSGQFSETVMPCMKRLPILVLLWLSIGEISGENYLFGHFYGAILPVLYLAWTVYDLGLFKYKKRLFMHYRKKQSELYYRDLKTVLHYVVVHSVFLAGFVLALHKSYLAIWGQQTFVSFMELAAYSAFIALLGLSYLVLIDILNYRNMQAQAVFSVAIGTVFGVACAIIGSRYWGVGTLLYILSLCVQMIVTIAVAAFNLSIAVGIHYLSVLIHTSASLIATLVISLLLYGIQRLVFTALGGLATLLVCLMLGLILQGLSLLALKVFRKEELKELPLSSITGFLTRFF